MARKAINVKAVIKRLGGPTRVHALLVEEGHRITKSAIEKWSSRGRIPSDWLATLIDVGRKIRKPISVQNCIAPAKEAPARVEG